jgi:hypothetical protein
MVTHDSSAAATQAREDGEFFMEFCGGFYTPDWGRLGLAVHSIHRFRGENTLTS